MWTLVLASLADQSISRTALDFDHVVTVFISILFQLWNYTPTSFMEFFQQRQAICFERTAGIEATASVTPDWTRPSHQATTLKLQVNIDRTKDLNSTATTIIFHYAVNQVALHQFYPI
jgi:hypothetical protein